jgi:hypothetical protein
MIAHLTQASVAKTRWRRVSMKDHSPSTRSWSSPGGHPASSLDGLLPHPLEIGRAHRGAVRVATRLGLMSVEGPPSVLERVDGEDADHGRVEVEGLGPQLCEAGASEQIFDFAGSVS